MPHQCFNSHSKLQKHRNACKNGFQRSFCYCSVLALQVRHTVLLEHRSLVEVRKKTNLLSPTLQETGSFCVPCLTLFGVVNVVNFLLQLWPQHGWSLWVELDLGSSDIAAGCCLQNSIYFRKSLDERFRSFAFSPVNVAEGWSWSWPWRALGGSGLFVQISQETSNGGGSKGRQGVKSVMERDHPYLPATSFLTKEKEQKESPPCQPPNLRSHGNQCIVSKSNHRVSTILSIGVALITCFGCIYQELQICPSR